MNTGPGTNDFTIKIANVNGTGSASANALLMKTFFRMGIPVVGKNYFPSNIQGLPTWYEVRVSAAGYLARSGRVDLLVAMNAETYQKDLASVSPGGFLVYDSTWPRAKSLKRDDIGIVGIPFAQLCNEHFTNARSRILMKNMAYVGALTALLDLDMAVIDESLQKSFGTKPQLIEANQLAIRLGFDYAREHYPQGLPFKAQAIDKTAGHIMIDGNTATALGCLYAGVTVGAWYPITPSTSVMDAFKTFCETYRIDEATGRRNYTIIQAEDELAAIGMVLGAGWNGARAFTPTSGPGISLMSEFLGYGYFTEIPAVLIDVQRCGPSTGMPTRTQQCDIMACAYASHGDTRHVLLFPANPEECFYLAVQAFDLAERLQTPVIVLTDLDIGMNDWMCRDLQWDESYQPDRGKVLSAEELEGMDKFYRYMDVDGDGIAIRTLPGTCIRRARSLPVAPGTTSTVLTLKTPTIIWKSSTGCAASGKPPRPMCRNRRFNTPTRATLRSSQSAAATMRYSEARDLNWRRRASRPITCACWLFRSTSRYRTFSISTTASMWSSRTAMRS
jgi:2-oxoglutarate ferredoxin oxidoreductase subunit alpha